MLKIFITGANGFIGKNIYEQLKEKYCLLVPTHRELDLLDEQQVDAYFQKNKIDIVIHSAVVGGSRKEQEVPSALKDNLRILLNILQNKSKFKKLIYLGSGGEYDKAKSLVKVKESDFGKSIPTDDYCLYKYISAKLLENLDNIVYLRIFGIFGKHEKYHLRFISNAIYMNLHKLPIAINQNVYFDYLYIDDLIKIIDYFIIHKVAYKFYNAGTGSKIDLISIAKIINNISDSKSKIIIKNDGLGNEYTCNNERLLKEIKNLQFTDINEAIGKLYNWYKSLDEKGLLK